MLRRFVPAILVMAASSAAQAAPLISLPLGLPGGLSPPSALPALTQLPLTDLLSGFNGLPGIPSVPGAGGLPGLPALPGLGSLPALPGLDGLPVPDLAGLLTPIDGLPSLPIPGNLPALPIPEPASLLGMATPIIGPLADQLPGM